MHFSTALPLAAVTFSGLAAATGRPYAEVVIEASHGGAGSGLTNTTVLVPIGETYTNATALAEVSVFYVVSAGSGPSTESVTCQGYMDPAGTTTAGLPFKAGSPARLSTNTVVVGSLKCVSSDLDMSGISSGVPSTTTTATLTTPTGNSTAGPTGTGTGSGSGSNSTFITTPTPTVPPTGTGAPPSTTTTRAVTGGASGNFEIPRTGYVALTGLLGLAFAMLL